MMLLERRAKQPLSLFLVLCLTLFAAGATAQKRESRFEHGPLLSNPDQYFDISVLLLNEPENALERQQATALAEQAYGARARDDNAITALDPDELARDYIASLDGWASAVRSQNYMLRLDLDPGAGLNVMHLPSGHEIRVPMRQAITLHRESIQFRGRAITKQAIHTVIAAQYMAETDGNCPFADGPVQIFQDQFLVEGRRGDQLLFWGAVGDSRAYFVAAETKFVKIVRDRRRNVALVEFPDKESELYSAKLSDPTLLLKGALFDECTISLTRQPTLRDTIPGDETVGTRLAMKPNEERIEGERISTPNVHLDLEEVERSHEEDGSVAVEYSLVASGFPIGMTFSLWDYRPLAEPERFIDKLYVDDSGEMMVETPDPDRDPISLGRIHLNAVDHQQGEAYALGLISNDSTIRAYSKAYPLPIESRQGDCHLYLELLDGYRTAFAAFGEGFLPNEEILTESRSEGEAIRSVLYADQDGSFAEYVFPEIIGMIGGVASFHVTSESCSVQVEYDWGTTRSQ